MVELGETPRPVASDYSYPWTVFAGIVVALAAYNVAVFRLFETSSELFQAMFYGTWVFQPALFGIWVALRPGRIIPRLQIAIPCLFGVIAAAGLADSGFPGISREVLIMIVAAAMAILVLTTGLLRAAQSYTRWQLTHLTESQAVGRPRVQFDIKYLLTLTALWAAALAIGSNLELQPTQSSLQLGPKFFVIMASVGGGMLFAITLPIIPVTLLGLDKRPSPRYLAGTFVMWSLVSSLAALVVVLLMNTPFSMGVLGGIARVQAGALILGAAVAAAVRVFGYRLTRSPADSGPYAAGIDSDA